MLETCNSTAWGPLAHQLAVQSDAHALLVQEHHLRPSETAAQERWARRCGWKAKLRPAQENAEGTGTSGGVGVAVRSWFGLADAGEELAPGRLAAAHWNAVVKGGVPSTVSTSITARG